MKKTFWIALIVGVLAYGGRLAWRAHRDLVSLDVHDVELSQVVRALRWQTWEPIFVGANVTGRVTLRVHNQPLEVVLDILNDQVNGRWTAVYPLYTSRKSLRVAEALARGDIAPPVAGWTQWNARPTATPGPSPDLRKGTRAPGAFGSPVRNGLVSAAFTNATPTEVASHLRRQIGARLVPEDGTTLPVTAQFEQVPVDTVVATVARKTFRKWTRFYVIEGRSNGPGARPAEFTSNTDAQSANRPPAPTEEQREQIRQQMAADPARQEQAINRMLSGLRNSTPQQRAERDQMRLARQQSQARR